MTTTKDLAEALRELIALKDLKEGAMERSIKASMSKGANPSERYHEWNADYKRRKPLAWDAARAALASHDAAQSAVEAPVPVAREQVSDAQIEKAMGWCAGAMNNSEPDDLAYRIRLLVDAVSAAPPSPAVERDERAAFEAWRARLWELIEGYRKGADWPLAMRDRIKHHLTLCPARAALGPQS